VAADASLRPPDGSVNHAGLDRWVAEENRVVTGYLAHVLRPDPAVLEPV
jgi:hypothetical protein